LIDVDGARYMPRQVPDVPDIEDDVVRKLLLHPEVIGDDAWGRQAARQHCEIRWEIARGSARRVIDISVEDAGRYVKWRIAARIEEHVGRRAIIKNTKPAADGRHASTERIIGKAETRPDVAVVGVIGATRESHEQTL